MTAHPAHISSDRAREQTSDALQRRLIDHLSTRPGWSTSDRLMSELFPAARGGIDRARYDVTKRMLSAALRRLQAIGYVRYDADTSGWIR